MIGQTIGGKYQIVRKLGEGGMGAVYEATHLGTGRRVALKVILGEAHPEAFERFQREAKAAGAIDTQHIVQVLDTGIDGHPYMVMEFLSGEDVEQLLQRLGPLPPEIALRIVAQACLGLQKAHDAQVVHRDIKPANLYLARRDAGEIIVKVLDFGIAKVRPNPLDTQNQGLTRTGSMLGSPLYMSPEQALGKKDIDHRTDLWSLGVVLYEALTGQTPHHHIDTLGQLIVAIIAHVPPPVQDVAPWVPPEAAALVYRSLNLDRDKRFPTAAAMFEGIRPLLPNGWALNEAMLAPLSPQARAFVAPRFVQSQITGPLDMGAITTPGMISTTGGASLNASQGGATQGFTAPKKGRGGAIAVATAASLLALVAAGAFVLRGRADAKTAVPPATTVAPPQPPIVPPPIVTAAAPAAPEQFIGHVAVMPEGATVEIDGKVVTRSGNGVDIVGELGSMHDIRVTMGGRETKAEIAITKAGAMPDKIVLGTPPPKPPRTVGAASAAGAAGGPGQPKPATKPADSFDKKFE